MTPAARVLPKLALLAASVEILAGIALLVAPATGMALLLGAEASPGALVMARFAGIGILTLGIACLPGRHGRALFFFNGAVAALFVHAGLTGAAQGVLLWPVVALHLALAAALGWALLTGQAATRNQQGHQE